MIRCTVCGTENDEWVLVCTSCKSYLQRKVDALNLFATIWILIESPRKAFKAIVLAQHKNYVLLLSSLLGFSLAFTVFWFKNVGTQVESLLTLLGLGILVGPPVGVAFVATLGIVIRRLAMVFGGRSTLRNTIAVVAYAGVPVVFTLVFVFPVELAVFGIDFFRTNPHPIVIKPVVYVILVGLDVLGFLWSWLLLIEGTISSNGLPRWKAALVTVLALLSIGIVALILLSL